MDFRSCCSWVDLGLEHEAGGSGSAPCPPHLSFLQQLHGTLCQPSEMQLVFRRGGWGASPSQSFTELLFGGGGYRESGVLNQTRT